MVVVNNREPVCDEATRPCDNRFIKNQEHSEQYFANFKFDETISAKFSGRQVTFITKTRYVTSCVASFGSLYLLSRWLPKVKTWILTKRCAFKKATHVLVTNSFDQVELVKLDKVVLPSSSCTFEDFRIPSSKAEEEAGMTSCSILTMNYCRNRFVFNFSTGNFVPIEDLLLPCLPEVNSNMDGLDNESVEMKRIFFGTNAIDIEEKSSLEIFCNELLHPFFVFQVASFFIWIYEDYYLYAVTILLMATSSAILTVRETKQNMDKMCAMARFSCPVKVFREGKICEASSEDLVPGDILLLDEKVSVVPCDGVLVNGDAIVDESMLTGETVPVSKLDLNDDAYEAMLLGVETDSKHVLFAGTRLLRCRSRHGKPTMVLVTRIGFLTTKGSLVQAILFPRPNNFRFYRDSMIFIGILGVIAFFGFTIAVANSIILGFGFYFIMSRALDVITVVVPPALPATMAVGTVFAIKRLEDQKIFCISPPRINVASNVSIFCFDKTGTLTEEGLEILGIIPVNDGHFVPSVQNTAELIRSGSENLTMLMATCHSLRRINGRLMGDSLDLKMFEFTNWDLEEFLEVGEALIPTIVRPPGSHPFDVNDLISLNDVGGLPCELGIIRQFDFSSKLRRMSVVVKNISTDTLSVFLKGSPESLISICKPNSIPRNYAELLAKYAHEGYRVIGCATKDCPKLNWLKAQKMSREEAECDLEFLGFIVFENRVKPETGPTIEILKAAAITNIMATGDNILTAISVGRDCGMIEESSIVFQANFADNNSKEEEVVWQCIDNVNLVFDPVNLRPFSDTKAFSLAISGDFFDWVQEKMSLEYRKRILEKCQIYARMSPHQKQLLVEVLQQETGAVVGFCGDGANDCGALKAADVGISLSQAEASIAAPFTSRVQNISCVPLLLKEGRASLVTSFCSFKYMTMYSMIQFTTLILLYSFGSTLSDGQFIFVDLLLIVPLGVLMTRYSPAIKLVPGQPTAKLISAEMLTSIFGHILIQAIFQVVTYWLVAIPAAVNWVPPQFDESNTLHPSTTVMFFLSSFLYVGTAFIFSAGEPFRQRRYWPFLLYLFIGLILTILVLFIRISWLDDWLFITHLSASAKYFVLIASVSYFILAILYEEYLSPFIASLFNREQ